MAYVTCAQCKNQRSSTLKTCPFCESGAVVPASEVGRVAIVDIDMPLGSMVTFMVKWAIAAIPALIILLVAGAFAAAILSALLLVAPHG